MRQEIIVTILGGKHHTSANYILESGDRLHYDDLEIYTVIASKEHPEDRRELLPFVRKIEPVLKKLDPNTGGVSLSGIIKTMNELTNNLRVETYIPQLAVHAIGRKFGSFPGSAVTESAIIFHTREIANKHN